jgi:hypothetical protein
MMWNELALHTAEMLVASAQVIGHRTLRMATAGHSPNLRDRREFTRMGIEKIEAAGEAAVAMGQQLATTNAAMGLRAWRDMYNASTALMLFAGSRTLPQIMDRQAKLMHTISRSAASASQLTQAAAHITKHGLKPIHSRATANAKRLSRLK